MRDNNAMDIQYKLNQLRQDWVKYPEKRKVIEMQAKMVKLAAKKAGIRYDKPLTSSEQLEANIKETLV